MDRNPENYILFKKTLGRLLYFAHRHPDPISREEYRHKYESLLRREDEYKVTQFTEVQELEVSALDRLIRLYDTYNTEISDLRKSEIFSEIIKLSDEFNLRRDSSEV